MSVAGRQPSNKNRATTSRLVGATTSYDGKQLAKPMWKRSAQVLGSSLGANGHVCRVRPVGVAVDGPSAAFSRETTRTALAS